MTYAKLGLFDKNLQELAELFKALGHPARLAIVKYLAECDVCMTGDITREIPLSRTTVVQHLHTLKEAGIIRGDIEGSRTNYCLNPEAINMLMPLYDNYKSILMKGCNTGNC